MSDTRFDVGKAYIGTATIDHNRKKVFQIVGRKGGVVSVMRAQSVKRELVDGCDGKEFVRIKDDDGFDYFLSASVTVDVDAAFAVAEMCK